MLTNERLAEIKAMFPDTRVYAGQRIGDTIDPAWANMDRSAFENARRDAAAELFGEIAELRDALDAAQDMLDAAWSEAL